MRARRKDGTFTSTGVAVFNFRHGEAIRGKMSREYAAFRSAKGRCTNKNNPSFQFYGGRGIKFLFRSFHQFLAEVKRKPSPKHVLDRINNDGHYQAGNLRWATRSQSVKNRRVTNKLRKTWSEAIARARTYLTPEILRASGRRQAKIRRRNHLGQFS